MANSSNRTFRTKIREELICAICLDFLQEPKVLLCAHSFCKACLEQIISTINSRLSLEENKRDLECPSCRQVTPLATGKVAELKTNFNLKRLVNIVSEEDKIAARDALQRRRTVRPSIRSARSVCKQHYKPFEYYCLDCRELLCPRCVTSGHRDHQFQDVDEVLPREIEHVRSLIQPAYEVASQAESLMKKLFEDKNKVSDNSRQVSDSVEAYFKKIRQMLDQREKAMLSTVQKYSDIKLTRLDVQYQTLEQHRTTILEGIAKIEELIDNNDNVGLLSQKQTLSEDLEDHEQSIITLSESLTESQMFTSLLLFREDQANTSNFSELGTLNECRREPNSLFMSLRRVIVTEEEDPYLDVPLRFEDMDGGEHMRIDESKERVEYEPESKPNHNDINQSKQQINVDSEQNIYNVPKPVQNLPPKPHVPPRKSSIENKRPIPPPRPHIPSHNSIPDRPPKPEHLQHINHNTPNRSVTMPRPTMNKSSTFTDKFLNERRGSDESDGSDYEPLPEIPTPLPRNVPPPLPPNHPSKGSKNKPIPRPRRQISGVTIVPPPKSRSNTLPSRIASNITLPSPQAEVLKPILVIDNKDLSWPYSHENVYPSGVCCCTNIHDTLIVTDVFNHCVRLIDFKGKFIEKVGREGRSGGQFKEPSAVAVDHSGHIYVTERDNPRVQKFTSTGKYITKFGQKTLRGSQLSDPVAIAVASNGQIVVSDWEKNQVFFYSSSGKLMNVIAKDKGFLKLPAGIAFNKQNHIFVTDRGNHCVWKLTVDGDLVNKIGSYGSSPGQLNFPYGVVIDDYDQVIVSESGISRISIFTQTGEFVRCFGQLGTEPGMFDHPRHLCLNSKQQLIVADEMNQRLQVFEL